jgi:hypothetical protein
MPRRKRPGPVLGQYYGPKHSGRSDVLFRVLYAPDDCELLRPLWNVGAEFTTWDVAGMVMDGGLPEGTRLRDADGTEWTVRDCALREADGPRLLAPVETNKTDRIATLREVTGCLR